MQSKGPPGRATPEDWTGTQQYGRSFVSEARQEASGRGGRCIRSWGGAKEKEGDGKNKKKNQKKKIPEKAGEGLTRSIIGWGSGQGRGGGKRD